MNAPPALSETSDPASLWVIHSPAAPPPPAQRALQATCTCLARRKQRSQNRAPQVRAPAGKCGSKSPPPHAPACPTRAPLTLSRHSPKHFHVFLEKTGPMDLFGPRAKCNRSGDFDASGQLYDTIIAMFPSTLGSISWCLRNRISSKSTPTSPIFINQAGPRAPHQRKFLWPHWLHEDSAWA